MNRLIIIIVTTLAGILLVGFLSYKFYFKGTTSYIIPNVPDYTFYNVGFNAADLYNGRPIRTSAKAVLDMVYDYWNQEKNSLKTYPQNIGLRAISMYSLAHFALFQTGFDAQVLQANSIQDLYKFINPQERTPVIVLQKTSLDYPGNWLEYRLIIGLDDKRKKVIAHDFILGNNYELDYGEFDQLWQATQRYFLIIRPRDYKERLKLFSQNYSYPQRIPAMDQKKINIYYLLLQEKKLDVSLFTVPNNLNEIVEIFDNLLSEENNFQYFPRWFRVLVYGEAAERYLQAGQLAKAESLIPKIIENNSNLKENFSGWQYQWPGSNELVPAWIVIGDIYRIKGDKKEALNYYNKALASKNLLIPSHRRYLEKVLNELSK